MNAPESLHATAATARRLTGKPLERSRLAQRLRRLVKGEVMFDAFSRGRYATDASIYQVDPVGVLVPADETDVVAAIDLARELRIPLLPRGGGTSQCGQTVGEALVIDNSKHLRQVIDFDAEAMTVQVQPGIVLDHLNAWLKPHGLWFPVDVSTAAQATLGGMAGNNSCGSRSIAYGNMVHNVLGIDAILSDGTQEFFGPFGARESRPMASSRTGSLVSRLFELGHHERAEIERVWPKVMRRVGGYNLDVFHPQSERPYTADGSVNLAHLLVGSEGTLAYFRRLHLKLSRLPAHKVLGVVNFASFHRAMDSAQHIVRLLPCAVELVDRTMIDLARNNPVFRATIETALVDASAPTPEAILLVEFAGDDRSLLLRQLADLTTLMGDLGLPDTVVEMPDAKSQKLLWDVRKAGLNIMMSARGDGKPVSFIEDCAVPLEHLAEYTAQLTDVFERHGTRGTWYAHASVGTLHVRPILDMRVGGAQGGAAKMRAIAEEAGELVRRYRGAFSGEHGDGLVRSEWVDWQYGPRITKSFEKVKALFDPDGLMNPGKIVHATKMDDATLFRFAPGYEAQPLTTALDWSAWNVQNDPVSGATTQAGSGGDATGGWAKAVEMCNNNGHCRKFDADTMCPSYRVTRDEQHLTRGRANTLRLALSGQLGENALTSPAMAETMDLCVGCKGCKRDCPTGVDMARMKVEFQHHYRARQGATMLQRMVGDLPRYADLAARFAPLLNLRNRSTLIARLMQRMIGVDARRSLPRWHRHSFLRDKRLSRELLRGGPELAGQGSGVATESVVGEVVLWVDTFNNHFEPEVLRAALKVLRGAGYRVHLAQPPADGDEAKRALCCGRTYLATGLVDKARAEAVRTLKALLPYLRRGATVVGLEPSCLLTMRDEFTVLKLADTDGGITGDDVRRLADNAMLFEEFLVREKAEGRLSLNLAALHGPKVLVHGHCHQKAFDAFTPVQTVLKWIPDVQLQVVESSCCGMAGAFGLEHKHYDVSSRMAEASLLPAVREAGDDALIVADGTSCRHQILDGTQRHALHVAQVLAESLYRAKRSV